MQEKGMASPGGGLLLWFSSWSLSNVLIKGCRESFILNRQLSANQGSDTSSLLHTSSFSSHRAAVECSFEITYTSTYSAGWNHQFVKKNNHFATNHTLKNDYRKHIAEIRGSRLSNSFGLNVKMAFIHKINASERNNHVERETLKQLFLSKRGTIAIWTDS